MSTCKVSLGNIFTCSESDRLLILTTCMLEELKLEDSLHIFGAGGCKCASGAGGIAPKIKSLCCSCSGPKFGSLSLTLSNSQPPVTRAPGDLKPFGFQGNLHTHAHMHAHTHHTCMHRATPHARTSLCTHTLEGNNDDDDDDNSGLHLCRMVQVT